MKPVNIMDKNTLLFFIFLFSGGLKAFSGSHAQIIRNEVNVCEGHQATLPCGGSSNTKFRWKLSVSHGRKQRIPHDLLKYTYSNSSLIVKNVQQADTKRLFYCKTQSTVHHFRDTLTYIYSLKIICKDIVAYIGSQISLYCNVDIPDNNIEKIEWRFRSKHHGSTKRLFFSKSHNKRIVISGRNLTVKKVRGQDCGTFICLVSRKNNFHLSKGRYFYDIVVKKALVTTAKTHSHTSMVHSTKKSISSILSVTTIKITAVMPGKKTTISRTNILPSFPIITTKIPLTEKTQIVSSHDGTATLPNTQPVLPNISMRPGTSTYHPSTKLASTTNKHSTCPTMESHGYDKLQSTINPRQGGKTANSSNAVESSNDSQKLDEATTVRSSSGITLPGIALPGIPFVGLHVFGFLIVLIANE